MAKVVVLAFDELPDRRNLKPHFQPIVGMTPTPDGKGYWFVVSDGGIFAYGDATFYGSTATSVSTSRLSV